jgi:hypothetical protein
MPNQFTIKTKERNTIRTDTVLFDSKVSLPLFLVIEKRFSRDKPDQGHLPIPFYLPPGKNAQINRLLYHGIITLHCTFFFKLTSIQLAMNSFLEFKDQVESENEEEIDIITSYPELSYCFQPQNTESEITEQTSSQNISSTKEVSKFQRAKRRAFVVSLELKAVATSNQIYDSDLKSESVVRRLDSIHRTAIKRVDYLIRMCFSCGDHEVKEGKFVDYSCSSCVDLSEILDLNLCVGMPQVTLHYSRPSSSECGRSFYHDLSSLFTYTEGYESFCCSIAHLAGLGLVNVLHIKAEILEGSFVLENTSATARFTVSTVNAVLCGGKVEFQYEGLIFVGRHLLLL